MFRRNGTRPGGQEETALNSLDIERSRINYFRPGINSTAFFHEDVKALSLGALREKSPVTISISVAAIL